MRRGHLNARERLTARILMEPLLHSRQLSFPIVRGETRHCELLVLDRVRKIACRGGGGGQSVNGESVLPIAQVAGLGGDGDRSALYRLVVRSRATSSQRLIVSINIWPILSCALIDQ